MNAKKNEKNEKKVCLHVGMCADSVHLYLHFMTCGCSKYLESLKFLRSRFEIRGRENFFNDYKGLHPISGLQEKKML